MEYELDFAAQADQTLSGSSATIAGKTWTVSNAGNASTFRLVEGAGLEIASTGGTEFSFATKTAPWLEIAIASLVPDYARADRLYAQVRAVPAGLASDGQAYGMIVGSGTHTSDNWNALLAASYSSGAKVRSRKVGDGNDSTDEISASEPRVLGMEWRPPTTESRISGSASGWPAPRDMALASYAFFAANIIPGQSEGWWHASTDAMRLYAERGGSAGAFTATFRSLRLLRQRG